MTIGRMLDGLLRRGHEVQLVRPRQHAADQPARRALQRDARCAAYRCRATRDLRDGLAGRRCAERARGPVAAGHRACGHRRAAGLVCAGAGPPPGPACDLGFPYQLPQLQQRTTASASSRVSSAAICRRFHNRALCTFVPTRQLRSGARSDEGYRGSRWLLAGWIRACSIRRAAAPNCAGSWGVADGDPVVALRWAHRPGEEPAAGAVERCADAARMPRVRLVLVGDGPAARPLQRRHPSTSSPACAPARSWLRTTPPAICSCSRAPPRPSATSRSRRWRAVWRWSPTTTPPRASTSCTARTDCWRPWATAQRSSVSAADLIADAARIACSGATRGSRPSASTGTEVNDEFAAALARYAAQLR